MIGLIALLVIAPFSYAYSNALPPLAAGSDWLRDWSGTNLVLTSHTGPTTDAAKVLAKEFEKITGATVEVIDEGTTLSALFICKNSEVTSETKIITKHTGNTDGTLFSGIFPYKKIALCTHFSDLCNTISLYAKDDYPLIIKYTVANLGNIKFCFAPIEIEKVFTIMN